jgi:hypothetical protein
MGLIKIRKAEFGFDSEFKDVTIKFREYYQQHKLFVIVIEPYILNDLFLESKKLTLENLDIDCDNYKQIRNNYILKVKYEVSETDKTKIEILDCQIKNTFPNLDDSDESSKSSDDDEDDEVYRIKKAKDFTKANGGSSITYTKKKKFTVNWVSCNNGFHTKEFKKSQKFKIKIKYSYDNILTDYNYIGTYIFYKIKGVENENNSFSSPCNCTSNCNYLNNFSNNKILC